MQTILRLYKGKICATCRCGRLQNYTINSDAYGICFKSKHDLWEKVEYCNNAVEKWDVPLSLGGEIAAVDSSSKDHFKGLGRSHDAAKYLALIERWL